jgi:hypothetical protein
MGTAIQVSVVIAAIVCAVCAIYFSVRDENPRNKLALCFFGLMALFVSSSLYFEFCGFGVLREGAGASVVTVYRNGEWTSSRWGAFELGEGQTFNVPDEFAATRSVTPITENPKARRVMKPFGCPFCPFSTDTPAKLWGHYGRCVDAVADTRSAEEKRAIVQVSVREGNERLVRG